MLYWWIDRFWILGASMVGIFPSQNYQITNHIIYFHFKMNGSTIVTSIIIQFEILYITFQHIQHTPPHILLTIRCCCFKLCIDKTLQSFRMLCFFFSYSKYTFSCISFSGFTFNTFRSNCHQHFFSLSHCFTIRFKIKI